MISKGPHFMKRLVLLVAVLAVVVAACSSSSSVVASVGDTDITRGEVEGLVRADGEEILDPDFLSFLGVAIQWEAVEQTAASDFGIDPSDDEVDVRLDTLVSESGAASLEDYLTQANASEDGIRKYARQLIIQEAVESELTAGFSSATDEEVAAELAEFPLEWTEACAAHILVATEDEANDVVDRLEAGDVFADVAMEVSTDTGTGEAGGDLGCVSPVNFVEPFAEGVMSAELGVPTAPIESEFGFHVILVESRDQADDEVVRQYLDATSGAAAVDGWFLTAIENAVVDVDESIGVWVTEPTPQVLPAT